MPASRAPVSAAGADLVVREEVASEVEGLAAGVLGAGDLISIARMDRYITVSATPR